MGEAQLAFYSAWASIIGLLVSLISLAYVRSIKGNIVRFRRKQRVRQLTDDVLRIQDDAAPLSPGSQGSDAGPLGVLGGRMNKYEVLFQEILCRTGSRELVWRQLPRTANADIIFPLGRLFRQFAATLPREGEDFTVVLVEKKVEEAQLFDSYERHAPELLVLDQRGELVTTLTDSVIELKDMLRLAQLVEAQSDTASKLFRVPSAAAG